MLWLNFIPGLNFIFLCVSNSLLQTYHTLLDQEEQKEEKLKTKDKIEPQQIIYS